MNQLVCDKSPTPSINIHSLAEYPDTATPVSFLQFHWVHTREHSIGRRERLIATESW